MSKIINFDVYYYIKEKPEIPSLVHYFDKGWAEIGDKIDPKDEKWRAHLERDLKNHMDTLTVKHLIKFND